MLCNVNDIQEEALDFAAAIALGYQLARMPSLAAVWVEKVNDRGDMATYPLITLKFSGDWRVGGPALWDHKIHVCPIKLDGKDAVQCWKDGDRGNVFTAEHPLVAGMRCLVFHALGEQVDIPDLILEQQAELARKQGRVPKP